MRIRSAILIWLLTVSTGAVCQSKGPLAVFENYSRDAGTVTQGEIIRQVFLFTNKGSGVLEILNVEHS